MQIQYNYIEGVPANSRGHKDKGVFFKQGRPMRQTGADTREVCAVRRENGLGCRGCTYKGVCNMEVN